MDKFRKLRTYNFVMGSFHLVQAVAMYLLSNDFKLPVTTAYLQFDKQANALLPVLKEVAQVRIAPLVALFLLMSAFAHYILTLPGVYDWYVKNLKKGANYARWYEYALSSSLMIVLIAMLVGMYDMSSLILIFSLNAMMILFGLMMELHNQVTQKTNWTSFLFGSIAGIVPWITIALYLMGSGSGDSKAPDFVYWIFFSIFLFFNTFALNMFLQYKKIGKWKDYLWGEKMYILLSLLAKSALAWQIFAGTLRPV
ncbi:heliorhodopsin HeR [Candidatus Nomurabacteria bacterium]|nr:heliorhodopsin HeR [Candidatus Nomurabacteria bacterium]